MSWHPAIIAAGTAIGILSLIYHTRRRMDQESKDTADVANFTDTCTDVANSRTQQVVKNTVVQREGKGKNKKRKNSQGKSKTQSREVAPRCIPITEPTMLARLLYTNPVCLLSVQRGDLGLRSLMTISWLTATDNHGGFVASMNQNRYTAQVLDGWEYFVLSIPAADLADTVLKIGGHHGTATEDKINQLGIAVCTPGWPHEGAEPSALGAAPSAAGPGEVPSSADSQHAAQQHQPKKSRRTLSKKDQKQADRLQEVASIVKGTIAVEGCVAHIVCEKKSVQDLGQGHNLLLCQMLCAYVRPQYWSGNTFCPQSDDTEPYLTFFGSQTFGHVVRA